MATTFNLPIGLSDHSMGHNVAVAAISLGACVVEKHLTLSRDDGGPDSGFSMEPKEFADMVRAARHAERAIGEVYYGPTISEEATSKYRKSIFVSKSVSAGEVLTGKNQQKFLVYIYRKFGRNRKTLILVYILHITGQNRPK